MFGLSQVSLHCSCSIMIRGLPSRRTHATTSLLSRSHEIVGKMNHQGTHVRRGKREESGFAIYPETIPKRNLQDPTEIMGKCGTCFVHQRWVGVSIWLKAKPCQLHQTFQNLNISEFHSFQFCNTNFKFSNFVRVSQSPPVTSQWTLKLEILEQPYNAANNS